MFRYSWYGLAAGAAFLLSQEAALAQSMHESNTAAIESAPQSSNAKDPDLAKVGQFIFAKVNQFRGEKNRSPLRVNAKLTETANEFAHYLARTDKFSHTADGKEPWERVAAHGYSYCIVLENIAYEFDSEGFTAPALAHAFVEGWEHSPEHRRNMLDPDVGDTGIGVARSSKTGRYYAVQDFGRPRSKAIRFRVVNHSDATVPFSLGNQKESIRPGFTLTFELCRPSEVDFRANGKERAFHPKNGARLVLDNGPSGGYRIRQEGRAD